MRRRYLVGMALAGLLGAAVHAAEWDSIRGMESMLGEPDAHWFTIRSRHSGYVVDGDEGEVKGILTLSMFSPALRSHLDAGLIYSYGSFYTRTYYGDRSDYVLFYDAESLKPVDEVEIPPKSAGIGHSGMIGLVNERFVGVWNITPAMSVSIVDAREREFVAEISTPGCAAVYPVAEGFLMPCGDGSLQYVTLDGDGREAARTRSDVFFSVEEDPVFDYAVPTEDGWLFMSLEGNVFRATVEGGKVLVSEPFSIFADEEEEGWRIGGSQPFAYNAEKGLLVTVMHKGGGQETFEDGGDHIWGFSMRTGRRGYVLELEDETRGVALTPDAKPLMIMSGDGDVLIHDGMSGAHLRTIENLRGGLVQPLR
ncbi:MAG: amine dehydrogenase large subunit [Pseudomonadales bacterium]|nr:amine dehydrogenase large subunit [Pseudomonadales bacterium]